MAKHENELIISALDKNLHFWDLKTEESSTKTHTFTGFSDIIGLAIKGDEIFTNQSTQFASHMIDNLKNNVDVGERYDRFSTSGRDGQVLELSNGFLVQTLDILHFIDESNRLVSTIDYDSSDPFNIIQELVAKDNLLFVPLLFPSEVVIYDTSDLSNVTEVSRIQRSSSALKGNVAVTADHLYVPVKTDDDKLAITPYDISDPSEPKALLSFIAGESTDAATLHIDNNFLTVVDNAKGTLFDITNPSDVKLLDENSNVSTSGIGIGFDNDLFTVSRDTAGYVHRSKVNLAPEQSDLTVNLLEDGSGSVLFSATDNEQDAVSYSVVTEPAKGSISIEGNTTLVYSGSTDENGVDTALLMVSDIHGGSSYFNLNINIEPVNDAPVIETSSIDVTEDVSGNFSLSVTDMDSESFTYTLLTEPEFGTAELTADGMLTYLSNADYNGNDSIEVQVSDSDNATDSKIITVNVTPANDAPVFDEEPITISVPARQSYTAVVSATDIDDDTLTFSISQQAAKGNATVDQQGTVTYTPNNTGTGADTFIVTVTDASGASATKSISVDITAAAVQPAQPAQSNDNSSGGGSFNWFYLIALGFLAAKRRFKA